MRKKKHKEDTCKVLGGLDIFSAFYAYCFNCPKSVIIITLNLLLYRPDYSANI